MEERDVVSQTNEVRREATELRESQIRVDKRRDRILAEKDGGIWLSRRELDDRNAGFDEASLDSDDPDKMVRIVNAAYAERFDVLASMARRGWIANVKDRNGWSCLHFAVSYSPRTIAKLVSLGADVEARAGDGKTPLLIALINARRQMDNRSRKIGVVSALLKRGAIVRPEHIDDARYCEGDADLLAALRRAAVMPALAIGQRKTSASWLRLLSIELILEIDAALFGSSQHGKRLVLRR
jgi:hypothetical protein